MGLTDSGGSKQYVRDGVGVTSPVLTDGNSTFTAGGERTGGVAKTLHSGLKNDDLQTNASGSVIGERLYDAFGNVVSNSGAWSSHSGYGGKFGYQDDADSSLKLLGHRYYDSSTGRFLTRDPIKDGRNWYSYSDGNPLGRVDPDGLAYLVFDGTTLTLWSDDGTGKPRKVFTVPAYSGAPGSGKRDQGVENYGPIPEGEYTLDPSQTSSYTESWLDGVLHPRKYNSSPEGWGPKRVPLDGRRGTNMRGRGGFFLHGGDYVGSAGCLDVGPWILYVLRMVSALTGGKPIVLIVDYSNWSGKVPSGKNGGKKSWHDWVKEKIADEKLRSGQ